MFTGTIEATASILERKDSGLVIERPQLFDDIRVGSSIAISGVCLTITKLDAQSMHCDVVPTTVEKSKLGSLKEGDSVNLERAMRSGGRLDGHIVQGHCEGVGRVVAFSQAPTPGLFSARSPSENSSIDLSHRAPTPGPSPGPRGANACGAAGGGGDGSFNCLLDRAVRGVGSLRYSARSTVSHARGMRKSPTEAEEKLWKALRGNRLNGLYFRRQRPIGPFIVDFYCEELKLAVEVDGGFHQESEVKIADQEREEYLRRRGIHMLRCTNEDVLYRMDHVRDLIKSRASLPRLTEGERSEPEVPGEGLRVGARAEGNGMCEAGGSRVGARAGESTLLSIRVPDSLLPFIIPHGSITLDGVAFTVAGLQGTLLTVAIIPYTLEQTTFGSLKVGDPVNLETDILGRYLLRRSETCSSVGDLLPKSDEFCAGSHQ